MKLRYLVENRKGAGILVSGTGLGKTYLTQVLMNQFDERMGPLARVLFPRLSAVDLLAYLSMRMGVSAAEISSAQSSMHELLGLFERQLIVLQNDGRHPIFIIEDAHQIEDPRSLQFLLFLMNHQQQNPELSLILCGQPELLSFVTRLPALDERISIRCALRPMSEEETAGYVRHRLQISGCSQDVLSADGIRAMHEMSLGIPRRVNQLADLALLVGFADRLPRVSKVEIHAAADELDSVSTD